MSTQLRFLVVVCVLAMATAVVAGQGIDRLPRLASPIDLPVDIGDPNVSTPPAAVCGVAYSDLVAGSTFLPFDAVSPINGLPYVEYADDCHLIGGGALCSITIGYFEPAAPTVDYTVTVYASDAVDGVLGAIVAGPYTFVGLPGGFNVVTLVPPDNPILPADVWVSVTATPLTSGLVIAGGPPTTGSSHDYFLDVSALGLVFFGGSPLANFMIDISVDPSIATEAVTWGKIKSLYE